MPRQTKISVQNSFTKGLITEVTALRFPKDACVETFDCIFEISGRVIRRPGIDWEDGAVGAGITTTRVEEVYTEFLWKAVGGVGSRNWLVQQQGRVIHFFDVSSGSVASANKLPFTIDLLTHKPSYSPFSPELFPCQFTTGRGNLVIVNPAVKPLLVKYQIGSNTVSISELTIRQRDFTGLDDGLGVTERPNIKPQSLDTSNPQHLYNLINQGWYVGGATTAGMGDAADILNQWDVARSDSPSNADVPSLYRDPANNDVFDQGRVDVISTGNTEAPKGHFILDIFDPDRVTVMAAEGYTVTLASGQVLGDSAGSTFTDSFSNTERAFDDETTEITLTSSVSSTGGTAYLGKSLFTPRQITSAIIYGSVDSGFTPGTTNMTLYLVAKQGSAPGNAFDGTVLGSLNFNDTSDESAGRTINSADATTFWEHVWIVVQLSSGTTKYLAEVKFFAPTEAGSSFLSSSTVARPSTAAFFAGRVFYAGIDDIDRSTSIYFTQIIERDEQYSNCYQKNDPTNEHFTDLLPDDGGVIKIPEVGSVKKLFTYQTSLLVFADNGVWLISGSSQDAFQANDFQVRKLSSYGTNSPLSFVDAGGAPYWWADNGLFSLSFDANYNSFSVTTISRDTIQSFFEDVPEACRNRVKGAYCAKDDVIHWLFNTEDTGRYDYDRVLLLDLKSKAFYPWTISTGLVQSATRKERVRGIVYLEAPFQQIKFTITDEATGTNPDAMVYGGSFRTDYLDWVNAGGGDNYRSYFITGFVFEGETVATFQPNYVLVFIEAEDNASCFMRSLFDFAVDPDSGRWSTRQQVYNANLVARGVNMKKVLLRGSGRSCQMMFESETGKPFSLIGWSVWNTISSTL